VGGTTELLEMLRIASDDEILPNLKSRFPTLY
jgi:hypothetical protein